VLQYYSHYITDIYYRLIMKLMSSNVVGRLVPPPELEQRSIDVQPVPPSRAIGVLVIDDFDDLRGAICDSVRRLGYMALEANASGAAVSLLDSPQGSQVDIVLSDINLPDLSGIALAGLVQARWPHLKLLLMSGAALASDGGSIWPVLQKPFRRQTLAAALSGLGVTPDETPWLAGHPTGSTGKMLACTTA
jgi:CheY-like chemotaxis protein